MEDDMILSNDGMMPIGFQFMYEIKILERRF